MNRSYFFVGNQSRFTNNKESLACNIIIFQLFYSFFFDVYRRIIHKMYRRRRPVFLRATRTIAIKERYLYSSKLNCV